MIALQFDHILIDGASHAHFLFQFFRELVTHFAREVQVGNHGHRFAAPGFFIERDFDILAFADLSFCFFRGFFARDLISIVRAQERPEIG